MLENVPLREYQKGILDSEFASEEFKALARSWLNVGAKEISPFEDKLESQSWVISLPGKVGYPMHGEFAERRSDTITDSNSVRATVKINVAGSLIVFLTHLLPIRCGHTTTRDLYLLLKAPESQDCPLMLQWAFRCIAKYVIIPELGSLEAFIRAIIRLKKEGDGFGGTIDGVNLTLEKVKLAVPDDPELHKLADILGKLDSTKDYL